MKISFDSALALSHVDELETWGVAPTMVRGTKGLMKQQQEREAASVDKAMTKKFFLRTPKKVEEAPADPKEFSPEDFRRSEQGRGCIKRRFNELFQLDGQRFRNYPLFDVHGFCRMKYEPAKVLKWEDLEQCVGRCMEMS